VAHDDPRECIKLMCVKTSAACVFACAYVQARVYFVSPAGVSRCDSIAIHHSPRSTDVRVWNVPLSRREALGDHRGCVVGADRNSTRWVDVVVEPHKSVECETKETKNKFGCHFKK